LEEKKEKQALKRTKKKKALPRQKGSSRLCVVKKRKPGTIYPLEEVKKKGRKPTNRRKKSGKKSWT